MQKKKQLKKPTYSILKSLKNRLSFASHKKKSFLNNEENIEVLELDDIEILDFEEPKKVVIEEIEQLELDEDVKLKKQVLHLKPLVKRRIQYASYALGAFAVILLAFSFLMNYNTSTISIAKILTRLGIYTEEISQTEDVSNDYDNPGSWKIEKSAKWTGKGKAQITFNLSSITKQSDEKNKDVILVLDNSVSMNGEKLSNVVSGSKELIDQLLLNENNKVAVISYSDEATILSGFTKNKDTLYNALDSISSSGNTNYYKAFLKTNEVMNDYTKEDNKDVIVLFLTDGYSTTDISNQKVGYRILKDNYPYIIIKGIQYEMGSTVNNDLRTITDEQFTATKESIKNVLAEAALSPDRYQKMIISDTIDDAFTVDSINQIKVSKGEISLEEESGNQKVVWNLGENTYSTGTQEQMTIHLTLKNEYLETDDFFPINVKDTIVSQLPNNDEITKNSTNTPVLQSAFRVIYNANPPSGCNVELETNEKHIAYTNVSKNTSELSCDGYLFKGWSIDEDNNSDIIYINDDEFLMPQHDVHIRATWSKQEITKTMNGTVFEKMSLYDVIARDVGTGYAKEYTYPHQDSMNPEESTEKIYYYDSSETSVGNNNVIFADQCWQMLRTTDTGGVKMIYNGEAVNGKCLSTREKHSGYSEMYYWTLSDTYYYGSNFSLNNETKKYSLSVSDYITTGEIPPGTFTCRSTSSDGTCSTLLYVLEQSHDDVYLCLSINANSYYNMFGSIPYNKNDDSIAYVGYMYDKEFKNESKSSNTETIYNKSNYNAAYYFGTDYERRNTNYYVLAGTTFLGSSVGDLSELVGNYTLLTRNLNQTTNPPRYVAGIVNNKIYNIKMQNGQKIDDIDVEYLYGTELTDLGNGYYSINSSTPVKRSEWIQYYSNVQGKYLCEKTTYEDMTNACINPRYVYNVSDTDYRYWDASVNMKFSNNFVYENGTYILDNSDSIYKREFSSSNTISELENRRYTCFNESGQCETVSAVYRIINSSDSQIQYINITGGLSADEAINSMLYSDTVNQKDSTMKKALDAWYEYYINSYSDYIDDVIYCNDRRIKTSSFFGNPFELNNSAPSIDFSANYQLNSLKCENVTDSFSKTNTVARLNYPVGLLTNEEAIMIGQGMRVAGDLYYTMSPKYIDNLYAENKIVDYAGLISSSHDIYMEDGTIWDNYYVHENAGVRPVIALRSAVDIIGGDGSQTDPYLVDMESQS